MEELIRKSLLERIPDTEDRRRIHLKLRPEAVPVTESIDRAGKEFRKYILEGFAEEELVMQDRLFQRLTGNVKAAMERMGS